jgi:hypothetical protein
MKVAVTGRKLNYLSTFQNVKDQNLQTNFASFTHAYEKWSLNLREEHELQVLGKEQEMSGPIRDEVTEQFITLHKEDLCYLYRSAGIVGTGVARGWTTEVRFPAGAGKGFLLSSTPRPDQVWDPPSLT